MVYFVIVNRLLRKFEYMDIQHIPRLENQEANDLAQLVSGYRVSTKNFKDLVEIRGRVMATKFTPSDLESMKLGYAEKRGFEILAINTLSDADWRSPLVSYLANPTLNMDRKTKYRALSYLLMGNELFKKTQEGVLLKCVGESEAYLALSEVHNGACGAHQAGHKMKWLLF